MSPKNDKSGQNHLPTPALQRSTKVPAPGFEGMVVMVAMAGDVKQLKNRIRNSCGVLAS